MENPAAVQSTLDELDLQVVLEIIEALVKEIPENSSEAVSLCIKNIERCITKIHTLLQEINKEITYHKTKWFSSWRSLHVDNSLNQLRRQKGVLDHRIDLLMKVMAIHKEGEIHRRLAVVPLVSHVVPADTTTANVESSSSSNIQTKTSTCQTSDTEQENIGELLKSWGFVDQATT